MTTPLHNLPTHPSLPSNSIHPHHCLPDPNAVSQPLIQFLPTEIQPCTAFSITASPPTSLMTNHGLLSPKLPKLIYHRQEPFPQQEQCPSATATSAMALPNPEPITNPTIINPSVSWKEPISGPASPIWSPAPTPLCALWSQTPRIPLASASGRTNVYSLPLSQHPSKHLSTISSLPVHPLKHRCNALCNCSLWCNVLHLHLCKHQDKLQHLTIAPTNINKHNYDQKLSYKICNWCAYESPIPLCIDYYKVPGTFPSNYNSAAPHSTHWFKSSLSIFMHSTRHKQQWSTLTAAVLQKEPYLVPGTQVSATKQHTEPWPERHHRPSNMQSLCSWHQVLTIK